MRYIVVMILVVIGSSAYSQSDSLSLKEKNEKKVNELRDKINSLSKEEQSSDNSSTIMPRLSRIEEMMNDMMLEMKSMKEENEKKQREAINQEIERRMAAFRDSLMRSGNYSQAHKKSNATNAGEYYVIVESQKTLSLANQAIEIRKKRKRSEVVLLKGKEFDWYYLAIPGTYDYRKTRHLVNKKRSQGVKDAWYINANLVEAVQ